MSEGTKYLNVPFTFGLTRETTADIAARQLRSEPWPTIAKGLGWEVETLKAFYLGSATILIAALTAERDAAIAERNEARTEALHLRSRCAAYEAALGQDHADTVSDLAMLSAARDADRAMLGRIIGCEQSDASMVVLLERVEAMLAGLCVPGFVPPALEDEMNNTAETAWLRRQGFFDDGLVMRVAGWGGWVRWDDGLRQWEGVDASGVERCDPRVADLLRRSGFKPVGVPS